ncbi:MAG: glycerol acyltransferase [Deltaproteobacteria bacterium]|jgi:1-acyl-sn-glycerol-3-phosphate acyltransferase|nr:glycerol acyltransferase [Deltaproteobacteria bacterium]MBW2529962.1 glycerol acyltransferase [Deltaproteobacteria bacterium]
MKRYDIDSLDSRDPRRIEQAVGLLLPLLRTYFRPVIRGLERIPDGAALYVGNHNGVLSWDSYTFFGEVCERLGVEHVPYGLGHEITISLPLIHQMIVPLGAVRASHDNARRVFARGGKVLVYPGSDYDAFRAFRDRNRVIFGPRRGYLRLALRERVPIVPVVSAGAHEVIYILDDGQWLARALRLDKLLRAKAWPIALSFPLGLTIGPPMLHVPYPARFFQEALEPIRFDPEGPDAAADADYVERCHEVVITAMQRAMDRLVHERLAAKRGR